MRCLKVVLVGLVLVVGHAVPAFAASPACSGTENAATVPSSCAQTLDGSGGIRGLVAGFGAAWKRARADVAQVAKVIADAYLLAVLEQMDMDVQDRPEIWEAIRTGTKDPQIYIAAAMIARGQNRPDASLELSEKALALGARSAALHRLRAKVFMMKYDTEQAMSEANLAVSIDPNDAENYRIRSRVPAQTVPPSTRLRREISDLSEVIRLSPNDARAYRDRAASYHRGGFFRRAELDLDEALRLDPSQISAIQFERVKIHLSNNNIAGALKTLDELLATEPMSTLDRTFYFPTAHGFRAHLRAERGDAQGAEEDRIASQGLDLGYALLVLHAARTAKQNGDIKGASRRLDQVLKVDSAFFNLQAVELVRLLDESAKLHEELGETDLAIADLDRLAPLASQTIFPAEVFLHRAALKAKQLDFEASLADFDRARTFEKPGETSALLAKANFLIDHRRDAEAVSILTEAIAVAPNCAYCFKKRAKALTQLDRPAEALVDADKGLRLLPSDAELTDTRGHALEALGRTDEAIAAYRCALTQDPNLTSPRNALKRLGLAP